MARKHTTSYPMNKLKSIPLAELIREYLADLRLRNLSERTIKLYGGFLNSFERALSAGRKPIRLAELTPQMARAYITARMEQDTIYRGHPMHPQLNQRLSPHTIHREVRTLRAFGTWLDEQGLANPFTALKLPKLPNRLIEILDLAEVEQLLAAYNPNTDFGCRWQVMLAFALDTGVRVSELVGLQAADLEIDRFRAKVRGKGDKERYVFFGERTQRLLLRYHHQFRRQECPYFFQTLEGEPLTVEGAQNIMKHARQAGGVRRLHWHLLRHTFATQFLVNGGNAFELQELLGHTSLEMTKRYTHLAQHLSRSGPELRRRSPLDNLERRGLKVEGQDGRRGRAGGRRARRPDPGLTPGA